MSRQLPAPSTDDYIHSLLWDEFPECCGQPVVGAEYMGQQEMICCGNAVPERLSDAQIVAALREQFPEKGDEAPRCITCGSADVCGLCKPAASATGALHE